MTNYFKEKFETSPTTSGNYFKDKFEVAPPVVEPQSQLETFVSHAVSNLAPTAGFFAAGSAAATAGAPLAALSGPAAPFVEAGLFLGGGLLGSLGVNEIQEAFLPEAAKNYLAVGEKQNKYTALAGDLASFVPFTKLGLVKKTLESGVEVVDKPMAVALAAVGGGIDAAAQYIQTGEIDPIQTAINAVAMPFLGKGLSKVGEAVSVKPAPKVETELDIQNKQIASDAENAMNLISLRDIEASHVEHKIREEVLASDISSSAEVDALKLKEVFQALGRNKEGAKADSLIKTDAEALVWEENMTKSLAKQKAEVEVRQSALTDPNIKMPETQRLKLQQEVEELTRSVSNIEYMLNKKQMLGSTEHLLPVVEKIRGIYDTLGKQGVDAGVLKGMLYNYVPSIIDRSQSKMSEEGVAQALENFYRLKEASFKTDSAEQRMFNTARDLQEYLHTIDPTLYVHTDIATVTGAYMKSMTKAIAQKGLIDQLKNTSIVGSKKPIITTDPAYAMQERYVPYTSQGSKQLEGSFVHPDYAPILDHMFQQKDIGSIKNALVQTAMLTKALNVVGSLFHAPSLGWAMAGASPKLIFKEIITGGSGIRKAVHDLKAGELSEYTKLAIETGTKIGTEDVQRSIVADFGAYVDKHMFGGAKALGQVTGPLDKFILQKMNTFTWDYMHTGGKLALFKDLMTKAEKNLTEAPGTPAYNKARFELAKKISNSVNHTMGGLQWLQAANSIKGKVSRQLAIQGSGIESRAWSQVAMFAPDWTVSTLGSFLKGMPEGINPSKWDVKGGIKGVMKPMNEADLSRRYMINTGLLYLTILDAINLGTSGQHIWQNEDPTRILHSDGTTQQLAKHSMEFFHWLMDPAKTLKAKLGFFPKAGLAFLDDQGGTYLERLGTVAKLAAPFSVGSALQAPEGEMTKRALMSAAGFPIYGKPYSYLRDPQDVLKEKMHSREVRTENKMQKIEEMQRRAESSQLRGLFDDWL